MSITCEHSLRLSLLGIYIHTYVLVYKFTTYTYKTMHIISALSFKQLQKIIFMYQNRFDVKKSLCLVCIYIHVGHVDVFSFFFTTCNVTTRTSIITSTLEHSWYALHVVWCAPYRVHSLLVYIHLNIFFK